MTRFLFWLSGKLPCRIISDDGQPYLERYYVGTLFGVRFYLHRFVGSDPARGLHDHPWPWAGSLVLRGYYFEERRTPGIHKVRWFNWLTGDSFHRVVLPKTKQDDGSWLPHHCWTLFFHRAKYVKPWGFLKPRGNGSQDTAQVWYPWNYPKDGKGTSSDWWLTAPKGRDSKRESAC